MKRIGKIVIKIVIVFLIFFIAFNLIGYLYALITPKIDIKSANKFYLYDNKEELVLQGNGNEEWVNLEDMGNYIVNATVSVEDKNFYKHDGFNFLRIGGALFQNVKAGEIVQGASTITQQYARNLFLDFEKSWKRKWKEMWLTFELETHYSKDEIIEGYLNTINYGHGMYGVANASKYYFDKDVSDLTLEEVAVLAGIPNSPSNYSPIDNYELSMKRQNIVLDRMYNNKYITKSERDEAKSKKIVIKDKENNDNITSILYYYDAVMDELFDIDEIPRSYLETGGLKIYTALDIDAQRAMEESASVNAINDKVQTAKVMMNSSDGSISALIGGVDYGYSQYNRATTAKRQPGSTVKPFLYYNALEKGFTASTKFLSSKTTFNFDDNSTYSVKNAGNIYANKEITLAAALAYSDNVFAVKTHLFLGEDELVSTLKAVGIDEDIMAIPSTPLGTFTVTPIEITTAYATLSNSGKKIKPHFITKVLDIDGNVLYEYKKKNNDYVLDPALTFIISELLTGSYDSNLIDYTYPTCINMISSLTHRYALKSGSTDNDAWVIGYTSDYVLTSWIGYDDNSPISNDVVLSNKNSWSYIMEKYLDNNSANWYKIPPSVVGVMVNPITGELVDKNSKNKKILYYISGTEPTYNEGNGSFD